jgi:chromosome segregation ATPase
MRGGPMSEHDFFRLSERMRSLEGWQRDVAAELREMRDDLQELTPFVRQMREEEDYRRRKLVEGEHRFSTRQKVVAMGCGVIALGLQVTGLVVSVRGH